MPEPHRTANCLRGKSDLVRVRGVGPRSQPWEGRVIPLDYTRLLGKFTPFELR
jgi:hypothetical protein